MNYEPISKFAAIGLMFLLAACLSTETDPSPVARAPEVGHTVPNTAVVASPTAAPIAATTPSAREELFAPSLVPFKISIARAAQRLLEQAHGHADNNTCTLVIDPMIDANTGARTVGTAKISEQLEPIYKARHANGRVQPLTRQAINNNPLLIETLTPFNIERSFNAVPDAFRVQLTVIDLRTGRVVSKQLDRSAIDSVNPEPIKFYSDRLT
jgi:hypothetical protein